MRQWPLPLCGWHNMYKVSWWINEAMAISFMELTQHVQSQLGDKWGNGDFLNAGGTTFIESINWQMGQWPFTQCSTSLPDLLKEVQVGGWARDVPRLQADGPHHQHHGDGEAPVGTQDLTRCLVTVYEHHHPVLVAWMPISNLYTMQIHQPEMWLDTCNTEFYAREVQGYQ